MNISHKRLEEIQNIPDSAIDTSDIPELDDNFWQTAKMIVPITKKSISIRLDSDVLDWFKGQGKGYQSIINNVLRTYVKHQQNKALIPENYHSQDEDILLDSDIK
ncbi:MAG: BrnA antitoxin family protein [Snowella sp.]